MMKVEKRGRWPQLALGRCLIEIGRGIENHDKGQGEKDRSAITVESGRGQKM